MSVVSDSSPLIALEAVGHLDLLGRLYREILLPPAVARETFGTGSLAQPAWVRVRPLRDPIPDAVSAEELGPGETEAIALALETSSELILLDDLPARRLAERLGLTVTGVGGILLAAKARGYMPRLRPILDDLLRSRFRLSERLLREILRRAGEAEIP